MSAPVDLLVVGDVNPDVVMHDAPSELSYGQAEQLAGGAVLGLGGSSAITACGAARLGLRTAFVGVVGDDPAGRFSVAELSRHGVDASGVLVRGEVHTGLTVHLQRDEDRAMVTAPGCIGALSAEDVPEALLARARHVHVGSFFLQERLAPGLHDLFEAAHAAGATTSLDLNWDPSGRWDGGLVGVLASVDILFMNGVEAAAVSRSGDPVVAATMLAARVPLPVIKLGPDGAVAHDGCRLVRVGAPEVAVADTVGAGDSLDAGFLCGRLTGLDVTASLTLGVACGSLSTRRPGGTAAQPTLEEAEAVVSGILPETDSGSGAWVS